MYFANSIIIVVAPLVPVRVAIAASAFCPHCPLLSPVLIQVQVVVGKQVASVVLPDPPQVCCSVVIHVAESRSAALLELQVPSPLYHEHVVERSSEARGHMALPVEASVATALMLSQ